MARSTVYNSIVTDEKLLRVCDENKELLEEFKEYLQSVDRSPLTIINYESDINICFCYGLEYLKNKPFVKFNKRDIMKYQNYLVNSMDLSSNRVRRMKSALSSMANFIETILDDDYPDFRNIINKIPAPAKESVREKTVLEDEEIEEVLKTLVKNKEYQKACVLALAWASGSRKSELLRFKVPYFDDENIVFGSLYKTPEKIKTKGRGSKGKLLRRYVLINKFKPYFDLWMEERKRLEINDFEELFIVKRKGKYQPMKVSTLDSWGKKFSKMLDKDFYFHCMRHNFTTGLSQANIPASVIQEIIGWSSLDMVNLYDDTEIDDKLGKYFDEDGIKEVENNSISNL